MDYIFKNSAIKDLKKLPKELQIRILDKLEYFKESSDPLYFAEPLEGKKFGDYRFRVDDYRIAFDLDHDLMVILRIKHRREAYR